MKNDLEQQVLKFVMPRVWTSLIKLLAVLVKVIGDDLLPLQARILHILHNTYEVTTSDYKSPESVNIHKSLKTACHDLIRTICTAHGAGSGLHLAGEKTVPFLLRDIIPFQPVLSLNEKSKSNR